MSNNPFPWKKPPPSPSIPHINLRFYSCRHANERLFHIICMHFSVLFPTILVPFYPSRSRLQFIAHASPNFWIESNCKLDIYIVYMWRNMHTHTWTLIDNALSISCIPNMVILLTNQKMSTNAARINGIYVTRSNMFKLDILSYSSTPANHLHM